MLCFWFRTSSCHTILCSQRMARCCLLPSMYTLLVLSDIVAGQQSMEPAAAPGMAPIEVRTAEELQAAIEGGAEHIIVKDHLDTRNIQPTRSISSLESSNVMFWLREGTRFIQVCLSPTVPIVVNEVCSAAGKSFYLVFLMTAMLAGKL